MKTAQEIIAARNSIKNPGHGLDRWRLEISRKDHQSVATFGRDCPALRARLGKMVQECGTVSIVERDGFVIIQGLEK